MRFCILAYASVVVAANASPVNDTTTSTLLRAHAHNDYEHPRPLLDALDHGFASVETDVHLVNGELLVAHDIKEVRPGQTLQALYLDPLKERGQRNGGRIFTDTSQSLQLLVDIKSNAPATWPVLRGVLALYPDLLTSYDVDGTSQARAVSVVITGKRPELARFATENSRYATYDGQINELSTTIPVTVMPLVSDSWKAHFKWSGKQPIPEFERQRLRDIVTSVHAQNRKIRFWGIPDIPEVWRELYEAGVDYLNTDHLEQMRTFLCSILTSTPIQ